MRIFKAARINLISITILFCSNLNAATLRLSDDSLTVSIENVSYTNASQDLAARWGTWDNSSKTFTEITGGGGYYSYDLGEIKVDLDRTTQVVPVNTSLVLAVYQASPTTAFSSSFKVAVLQDPLWTAPTFDLSPTVTTRTFSLNTTALLGSFSFNSGTENINLIPEPSSLSMLFIGLSSVFLLRKRSSTPTKKTSIIS